MLEGIKALLGSEKAITGGVLVICATVLVAIGMMNVTDWQTYTRDIFIAYISGKTLQGAVSIWADTKKAPAPEGVTKPKEEVSGTPA